MHALHFYKGNLTWIIRYQVLWIRAGGVIFTFSNYIENIYVPIFLETIFWIGIATITII